MNGITNTLSSPDATFVSNATDSGDADNFSAIVPDSVASTQRLYQWAERDRIESAISKELWDANIELLQGDAAQEYLLGDKLAGIGGHSDQYATSPVRQLLSRHENLRDGIWAVKRGTPYCKPIRPNKDFHKVDKDIKYPNPPGQPATPLQPVLLTGTLFTVSEQLGLDFDSLLQGVWEKHLELQNLELQPIPVNWYCDHFELPFDAFWDFWRDANLPIAITEGVKKALSLTDHGMPAIALRGITQWHLKASCDLYSEIEQFATKGRKIHLIFDQDTKPKTVVNVGKQIKRLGTTLEAKRCKIFVTKWEAAEGKGIDDVLFNLSEGYGKTQQSEEKETSGFKIPAQYSDPKGYRNAQRKAATTSTGCNGSNGSTVGDHLSASSTNHNGTQAGNSASSGGRSYPDGMVQTARQALPKNGGNQCTVAGDTGNAKSDRLFLGRLERLREILINSLTLKQFKRNAQVFAALKQTVNLNTLSLPVERATTGEFMPELPALGAGEIAVVSASMYSGKTYRIGRDWIQPALTNGHHVLVLSPLNSLGQQTAKDHNIFHIHDQGLSRDEQRQYWEALRERPGLVMCPDSIGKIPQWFWEKPVLLILDEGNQVTEHICQGDTLKSRYSPVMSMVTEAARHAIASGGAIVLSEDGIPDRCVKFWQQLSGAESVRCFTHKKQGAPWDVTVYEGDVSGFRSKILKTVQNGKKIIVKTASQQEAKRLHRVLVQQGVEGVVRIDSETNEGGNFRLFFRNPDQWLRLNKPTVLILSPSAKSGVSIQGGVMAEDAYFDEVWGYFPSLDTSTHMQLLGRYRPPVPRFVWVAPYILGNSDERQYVAKKIKSRWKGNIEQIAKILDAQTESRELSQVETAVMDYLADSYAVSGSQKAIAKEALVHRLDQAGHIVNLERIEKDSHVTELWRDVKEAIWQEEALEIANAQVEDGQDVSWAFRTLDSMESSREDRIVAHKVLFRDEFPGVRFDDFEECYEALVKDRGAMRRGVLMQARAQNLETVKQQDKELFEVISNGKVRAAHRLPKSYIRAAIIEYLGLLLLLNGDEFSNSDKRCIAIKNRALKFADEIFYWLRLQIKPGQSPVEICNKLLRKVGLKAISIRRPGRRGQQKDRIYCVEELDNPIRQRLLKAACSKLSGEIQEVVSVIRNKDLGDIQIVDTGQNSPQNPSATAVQNRPDIVGQLVTWGTSLSRWLIKGITDGLAEIELSNAYGVQQRLVPLSELTLEVA